MKSARYYQTEAVGRTFDYLRENPGKSPLIVLPTGSGKSYVMAMIIQQVMERFPHRRICIAAHVKELLEQNRDELRALLPFADIGVYSAGLNRRELKNKIIIAGIQSIHKHVDKLGVIDLLMVDEAHLISRDEDSMYGKFITHLKLVKPDMRIVGLTATHYRMDSGYLHQGPGALFDGISYEADTRELIDQGFLCHLTNKATKTQFDLSKVHLRGGEYIASELENAMMDGDNTLAAIEELIYKGQNRKSWLIFASGLKHAAFITKVLLAQGIPTVCVTKDTTPIERASHVANFRNQSIRALVNVGVFTTGFNAPGVDLIALLRPTQSTGLYVQMVGRGLRLAEGKVDTLILDFGQNILRHGPIDKPNVKVKYSGGSKKAQEEEEDEGLRVCPACLEYVQFSVLVCPVCGHEVKPEPRTVKVTKKADEDESILKEVQPPRWLEVTDVSFSYHQPRQKPTPSLRVDYFIGYGVSVAEWVCFEHTGFARDKAEKWWDEHDGPQPYPENIYDAINRKKELVFPVEIRVKEEGNFEKIIGRRFAEAPPPPVVEFDDNYDDVPF